MQRYSLVDLGSNTARMVIYGYEPGRWFRLINEIREPVRLGEGMGRSNELTAAAIERAAEALKLYADFAATRELERPGVIATSALRNASNAADFFERIAPLGLQVDVLPGEEEAALAVVAVANSFALRDAWVMDLGGGSAQLAKMENRLYARGAAHPLGIVRLSEAFLHHDPPLPDEIEALEAAVAAELRGLAKAMRRDGAPLVAMGGTIRNLATAVQKRRAYPLGRLHGYELRRKPFEKLVAKLLGMPGKEREKVRGISSDRADVILAGALVYRWLLRRADRDRIWISRYGVREGMFLRHFLPAPHLLEDVRGFSVSNLFSGYAQPPAHTEQVRRLSRRLFDGLKPLHNLGAAEADLLDKAAYLHDIGMAVGYHNHHKHGAYLIEKSHLLAGFTHREQALLMLLVRYHRRGVPRAGAWSELMEPGDDALLVRLAACLRIAEHLERAEAGRIWDVHTEIHKKNVVLRLVSAEKPSVEIWEAKKQAALFEQAFERELLIEHQPP